MDAAVVIIKAVILVSCLAAFTHAQTCKPCAELRCKDGKNCESVPLVACPPIRGCVGEIVKDECGCCDVCMTTIGQTCRDVTHPYKEKKCAKGLKCVSSQEMGPYQVRIENEPTSRCERDTKQCLDPISNKSYQHGEVWIQDDFACNVCVCSASGQPKCSRVQCVNVTCADNKRVEDRCYSFCMQDDWDKGCQYDGSTYFDGEIITLQDHRSVCKCNKQRWACTVNPTHGFQQLAEKPRCTDEVKDEPLGLWSVWLTSECAHCECNRNARGNCSVVTCASPRCENPFRLNNRCCAVCPEDYSTVCHYDGNKYFDGEKVVLPDRCTLCTCTRSEWRCSSQRCKGSKFIKVCSLYEVNADHEDPGFTMQEKKTDE